MSLLNSASLVVTPNGYKEGTLYSVIPNTTLGDMTVVRATTATRVNSAGLIELVPYNLLQQSETFTNAIWTNANLAITTNTIIAPNGTTTADTLTENSTSTSQYRIYQTAPQSTNIYTISVYVKNITGTRQAYIDLGPVTGFFNFASETTYSASGIASFENVGNGWYRFSLTTATAITPSTIYMGLGQSNSETYTGNGTSAIAFWGAQLNIGSVAKDYLRTETRLNIPRLDYSNGSCPSLLVEPQSTNLYLYSEQLNLWSTVGSPTITANDAISPDGTTNADRVQFSASGNLVYNSGTGSAGTNVLTVYAKAKTGTAQKFRFFANGATTVSSDFTATNQWQRFEFVYTYSALTAGLQGASTGASDVLFWGFQHEVSNYATSYIPTTTAAVTRNADEIYKTGISSLIGQTEGTIFIDFDIDNILSQTINPVIFSTSGLNYIRLFTTGEINYVESNSVSVASSVGIINNGQNKIAVNYKNNDFSIYANGVLVGSNNSGAVVAKSQIGLYYLASTIYNPSLFYNLVTLFPTKLTGAECISLTTL